MFSLKKKLLCFLFLLFFAVRALAQNTGTVSGKLLDTIAHQSMGAATVELRYKKDSSVFGSQLANNDGSFSFNNVPLGNYLLTISFQGYRNIRRNVTLTPEVLNARLGNIYVRSNANELDAVTVVSSPPAVAVKSDTTEFGAGQYHVKPNSTTEDLIKKMPGIDVDQSGNIKAQGEQVQRVLVNGKRFFADDPKMATQNLPSDVIDKIQVFDDLSDQSKFSGMDDGNRVKTINIITRKEASVGYFGKIVGGGGGVISQGDNSGLYFTGAALHRFKGDQQLSVVAQANNTNQQMFTSQDILGTRGRGGQGGSFGSTPSGITRTFAGGLNYRDNWGKKTQVSGSYFYNNQRTLAGSSSVMESLSSDTALNNNQNSASNTINYTQNHRINFNLESNLDSMNALIFRPNFSTQSTNATGNSTTDIYRMNGMPVSHTDNASATKSNGYNGTVDAVFRHRFKKAGQTISADVSWTGSSNNNSGNYFNDIKYFDSAKANIIDSSKITNQQYTADSKSYTLSGTLSYTQPIAKNQQLELRYNHAYTNTVSNKTTYDFDSTTMAYDKENYSLTNDFVNNYTADIVTLGYHLNNQKINFNVGNGIQFGHQSSVNTTKDYAPIVRNYTNIYPTLNFRYVFSKTSNFRFNYTGRTSQPSISQLQPLTDSSNLLNITAGNPDLKQSFSHSFRAQYFSFNREKNINMFATVNFSTTQNAITNAITRLSNGGQYSQPINMNGNYNLSAYFNFGFPIKSPKSNLNFVTNFSTNKGTSLLIVQKNISGALTADSTNNISHSYTISENLKWTTNLDSLFDINFFTTPSYTINKYTASKAANPNFFSQSIAVEATWYTRSGWVWGNTFNYTYYKGQYNVSIPIWNTSFSKLLFKKKQGEIKLSVYDLLNKNKGISQTANAYSIQQTTTTVLRRYVQLTFTYNIRNFGGKNMPSFFGGRRGDGGGRRGGGGFGGGRDF